MGGSGFGTDAALMQKASQDVDRVRSDIQQAVSKMQADIEPAIGSWKGKAADVFRRLMEAFKEDADIIDRKLSEIGESIQTSGRVYQQQDDGSQEALSRIEGMLGGQ